MFVFSHFSFNSLSISLIFGCAGSWLLCVDFALVVASGGCSLIVVRGLFVAMASPGVEHGLQWLWHMGLVASWHVESSQTRDWTCVPCIGRWFPTWTTRERPPLELISMRCFVLLQLPLREVCVCFCVCVQSLSHIWLFVTSWTAAHQASLSFTISLSLTKFMSIASVMPSSHHILWHALLLPSIFPSIRDFCSE